MEMVVSLPKTIFLRFRMDLRTLPLVKNPGGGFRLVGMLDDIRIYDRELSGADVNTLYGSGNGDFVTVRTGNQATIKKAGSITSPHTLRERLICLEPRRLQNL